MLGEALAQPGHGSGQVPVLERCAVAQRAGLSLERCHVMPRVIERAAALEGARVFCDYLCAADHDDPLGIRAHGGHLSNVATLDAVAVAFEADQTGRRDPRRALGIAVKHRRHHPQRRALLVPDLCDLAFRLLRMRSLAG